MPRTSKRTRAIADLAWACVQQMVDDGMHINAINDLYLQYESDGSRLTYMLKKKDGMHRERACRVLAGYFGPEWITDDGKDVTNLERLQYLFEHQPADDDEPTNETDTASWDTVTTKLEGARDDLQAIGDNLPHAMQPTIQAWTGTINDLLTEIDH